MQIIGTKFASTLMNCVTNWNARQKNIFGRYLNRDDEMNTIPYGSNKIHEGFGGIEQGFSFGF